MPVEQLGYWPATADKQRTSLSMLWSCQHATGCRQCNKFTVNSLHFTSDLVSIQLHLLSSTSYHLQILLMDLCRLSSYIVHGLLFATFTNDLARFHICVCVQDVDVDPSLDVRTFNTSLTILKYLWCYPAISSTTLLLRSQPQSHSIQHTACSILNPSLTPYSVPPAVPLELRALLHQALVSMLNHL